MKSLRNRWLTSSLTIFSIALGVSLFLGIERIRSGVRESFTGAISQTDLIVGARGGGVPLLLYSVFHIGNATNNISYSAYEKLKAHPAIQWTIPISLGDSHRGYRVVATDENFFEHYRYRGDRRIEFAMGERSREVFDVVLGSEVSKKLKYTLNDLLTLSHGASDSVALFDHADKPFRVVGVLKTTGTPIDRSLYIGLQGMEAIHMDWSDGAPPLPEQSLSAKELLKSKIEITQITSFLLRTKSRIDALHLQREIQNYSKEPLMAVIPGVALAELWNGISYAEQALRIVSAFVILVGVLGLLASLFNSLNERRREMTILRVLGAGWLRMILLLVSETALLTLLGVGAGVGLVYSILFMSQNWIQETWNLFIPIQPLAMTDYAYLLLLFGVSLVAGILPALKAYSTSLADGLSTRI